MSHPQPGWAIAHVLAALLVVSSAASATDPDGPGEALFYRYCATCHVGSSALIGVTPPPDLFRDPLPRGDTTAALTTVIRSGAGGGRMPAFASGLDATETRALVAFIRRQRQR